MIVIGGERRGHAIAEAAGTVFNPLGDVVIARVEAGSLYGGVIFTAWTGASIRCHVAGFCTNWGNRELLWTVFDYAFRHANCNVILVDVPTSNSRSIDFCKHLGFSAAVEIPEIFPDGSLTIMTMRRGACRWLSLRPPRGDWLRYE